MSTQSIIYNDMVQFKSAMPVGFNSKEYYEDMSMTSICFLDRSDCNDVLESGAYDNAGLVIAFNINKVGLDEQNIDLFSTSHLSSKTRTLFAQYPNLNKVAIVRKGNVEGFREEELSSIASVLSRDLRSRGVKTVTNHVGFHIPTPFEEIIACVKSQAIMAAMRMDNYRFSQSTDIKSVLPEGFKSNFFDYNTFNVAPTADYIVANSPTKGKAKTTKRGKKRLRTSYSEVTLAKLVKSGYVNFKARLTFTVPALPEGAVLPKMSITADGGIMVDGKKFTILSQAGTAVYQHVGKPGIAKTAWACFMVESADGQWYSLSEIRKAYTDSLKVQGGVLNNGRKLENQRNIKLKDIVEANVLPTRTVSLKMRGVSMKALINDEGEIIVNGVAYTSPTGATNAALDSLIPGNTVRHRDGWNAWTVESEGKQEFLSHYKKML